MPKILNLLNRKFGRLTVIGPANRIGKHIAWKCKCKCGTVKTVAATALRQRKTKSCGCLHRENTVARNTIHGQNRVGKMTKAYSVWAGIVARCTRRQCKAWKDYGGRGIKICKKWRHFTGFFSDMGPCQEGYSIERKNVNGHYCKRNCKWIPACEQVLNQRRTLRVVLDGNVMPAKHAAEKLGVHWRTFTHHCHKFGPQKAVAIARKRIRKPEL